MSGVATVNGTVEPTHTVQSAKLDLAEMEAEAKLRARKQVANMLQRPDQLEKVDQHRRRFTRKKTSVEAMLKTAVQSQLDGVRTGMNQLQNALKDVRDINKSLTEVDDTYKSIESLSDKLKTVRDENSRHSQLAAAVENLKHIFTVPETVKRCQDLISDGKLLHAHKCLTDLENSRDDLLHELHKQTSHSPTDKNTVNHYFAEVEQLSEQLGKQLWLILQRTIMSVRREPTIIVTVLRIIEREERSDAAWLKIYNQNGFLPPSRPKRWRNKCFTVLEGTVEGKVEGSQMEDRTTSKVWLVRHLEVIRQLVIEDIRVIKTLCEPCFPPYYGIVNKYVEMYHNAISAHLKEIKKEGLEGNEIVHLLTWVGSTYNTKEMMLHPSIKVDTADLGLPPLLEPSDISELQNTYLQTMRGNFQDWMGNSLKSDIKDWHREQEPDSDDKGYFNTSLPVILFQMIEQNMQVAATINDTLVMHCLGLCVDELSFFAKTYKAELNEFKRKHLEDRSLPKYFLHYSIANINNCHTFADLTMVLKTKYHKDEFGQTHNEDRYHQASELFNRNASDVCIFLLDEVFLDLEAHVSELLTRKWLQGGNAADVICYTLEDYCQDFVHLKDKYYDLLLTKAQEKILTAYLKAILNRNTSLKVPAALKSIVFKNYEERVRASDKLTQEAEQFQQLFAKLAAKSLDNSPFNVIEPLSEVIKMKDTSMMSLELGGLVNKFPDITSEQLINLLLMRGDMGRSDARAMVAEIMGEEDRPRAKGIFSMVPMLS